MSEPHADLTRQLGLFPATNIVIADMIGAGIFTTSGLLLLELGSPLLMIALWVGGGILALCGALCYGALGAAMPRAGGEYAYLSELFHPLLGFLTGWISFFVGFSAPLAASSLGFSEYLARAFPTLALADNAVLWKKAVALAVIATLATIHMRGLAFGAKIQNYLTVGKVALIVALVAVGFAIGQGDLGNFQERVSSDAPDATWRAMGLSLMWIMFAYSGWNASGYIGSEIRSPRRNLPLSLIIGTGIVLLLYVSLNVLFVYAVPPGELQGTIAVGGLVASHLFGSAAERMISLLIAFALLSAIGSLIIIGPRVYYAMARDGVFFKSVARVHPVRRVPSTAIVWQCLIAGVMVLSGTFDQILTYMGFCLGIFPILAVLGVCKLPRDANGTSRSVLYVTAALIFAIVSFAILVLAYFERPLESSVALVTVAVGIPLYLAFARSKAKDVARYGRTNEKGVGP
ncbi:MAG: amino acid permease [Gemmatimonadota bacterium]|nr:amino acid permease [Gemmatimonadota bacterium]